MTAPSYTTDLTSGVISECNAIGTWVEPAATGWTYGAGPALDGENYIQSTGCISKAFNAAGVGGMIFNNAAGITLPTDGAFLGWCYWGCPMTLESDANGGQRIMVGTDASNFKSWDVGGSTTYVYGGWVNYAVNTTVTADDTVGTGLGNSQWVGYAVWNTNAITKGSPCACDVFRYGRCEARMAYGETANYATFAGFAAANDAATARWGLIQYKDGSYIVKGLIIFGYVDAVDFRDSSKALFIQNTNKVTENFNTFEVRQTGSRVDLTSIAITALGTVSRGRWVTTDNADVNIDSCVFTNMGVFGFASNSTILNSTFKLCDIITQNGATFTGCTIDSGRGAKAMVVDTVNVVTNTTFVSDGTGYALEGFSSAGDYTFTGLTFTGYASGNGTTGNEAIHVLATSGVVNLNITGGSPTPSVHTEGATVNLVSGSVNVTVYVKTTGGVAITDAVVLVIAADGGPMPYNVAVTGIVNSGTLATVTHTAHGMATNDKVQILGASLIPNLGVFTITKINDNSYSYIMGSAPGSSPTGDIRATYVALSGTSTGGYITMSRVFASSQPITGRVRKSTGSPLYKTGDILDTIDFEDGWSTTVMLILDE